MITITVDDAAVTDALAGLRRRMLDMSPAMAGIAMALESAVANRFESKTNPLGQAWAAWQPSTLKSYPKDGNRTLLDRYGDMLDSLTSQHTKDTAVVGFGTPYAAYHEWGTQRMQRRGLLFADPDAGTLAAADRERVLAILGQFLAP